MDSKLTIDVDLQATVIGTLLTVQLPNRKNAVKENTIKADAKTRSSMA